MLNAPSCGVHLALRLAGNGKHLVTHTQYTQDYTVHRLHLASVSLSNSKLYGLTDWPGP
jgi:hypothetical protein